MILLTGAGGTVGSEVLRQLRASGAKVRAGFHTASKAEAARASGTEAVVLDFADRGSVVKALQGVERLFLLGATAPNQVELETGVAREAKIAGVKHIVKLSVLHAETEAFHFAKWHREIERFIEALGVKYTHLRPNGFMQNFITYAGEQIRTQGAIYQNAGDAHISFVDVRDIGAVAVAALTSDAHDNQAYELTGPEALTHDEVARKISAATGKPVKYVSIPDDAFKADAMQMGVPEFYAEALVTLAEYYRAERAAVVSEDVERVLGRKPGDFDNFVRDNANAWK